MRSSIRSRSLCGMLSSLAMSCSWASAVRETSTNVPASMAAEAMTSRWPIRICMSVATSATPARIALPADRSAIEPRRPSTLARMPSASRALRSLSSGRPRAKLR